MSTLSAASMTATICAVAAALKMTPEIGVTVVPLTSQTAATPCKLASSYATTAFVDDTAAALHRLVVPLLKMNSGPKVREAPLTVPMRQVPLFELPPSLYAIKTRVGSRAVTALSAVFALLNTNSEQIAI